MQRFCVSACRLALGAWLGMAVFFSTVTLRPLRAPELEADLKPGLTRLVFPGYYAFGCTLLAVALVSGSAACGHPQAASPRWKLALVLSGVSLAGMLLDIGLIYLPLAEMMERVQSTHVQPGEFRGYHLASMGINAAVVALGGLATMLVHWPQK